MNLQGIVSELGKNPEFGGFARKMLDDGKFSWPKFGKNNDKAHPPIHPVKCARRD